MLYGVCAKCSWIYGRFLSRDYPPVLFRSKARAPRKNIRWLIYDSRLYSIIVRLASVVTETFSLSLSQQDISQKISHFSGVGETRFVRASNSRIAKRQSSTPMLPIKFRGCHETVCARRRWTEKISRKPGRYWPPAESGIQYCVVKRARAEDTYRRTALSWDNRD